MINQVYTTLLSIINKDNRGYVSPLEFNLYAELAQLSIFESMFEEYSKSIVKQNNRMYHSEHSDIPKHNREIIDIFVDECNLVLDGALWKPTATDLYKIESLFYNQREVEQISRLDSGRVLNNDLIAPTVEYPACTVLGGKYRIYPSTINGEQVIVTYIRKPKQPKWTYVSVSGNAMFNPSASDYQDFELPYSKFVDLVLKIMSYSGIEIREADIIQASQALENINNSNQAQ